MKQNFIQISVIIPSYNPGEELRHCLRSLTTQKTKLNYEIIVADSSPFDIKEKFQYDFPEVKFYQNKQQMLPGTARNFGVNHASGEILAFTDTDCVVAENWLQRIFDSYDNNTNIICGAITNGYPNILVAKAEYFMEFGEYVPGKKSTKVQLAPSCNFTIRKSLYEQVGGFKDFITSEDDLFSFQLKQQGEEIFFDNSIVITHLHRTIRKYFLKKQKELGLGFCLTRRAFKMPGYQITKSRLFTIFIVPLRFFLIWRKVLRHDLRYFFPLLNASPMIFIGLVYYAIGFWRAFKLDPRAMLREM